jgi:hypothetical protein
VIKIRFSLKKRIRLSEFDGRALGKFFAKSFKSSEIYLFLKETEEIAELILMQERQVTVDVGLHNWKRVYFKRTRPASEEETKLFLRNRQWLKELEDQF